MAWRANARQLVVGIACVAGVACGARSPLGVGDGASNDGGGATCDPNAPLALVATATIDTATATHEPEERPVVVWTGTSFVVAWSRWNAGRYDAALTRVDVSAHAIAVASPVSFDPGRSYPLNMRASWDGAAVALFFADEDRAIVMRRFDADGRSLGDVTRVVARSSGQTIVTGAFFTGDAHVLSWAVQSGTSWDTYVQRIASDGAPRGAPVLLYHGGGYDLGAGIVASSDGLVAAWSVHAEDLPTAIETTFVAALDAAGETRATETVLQSVGNGPVDLVAEPSRLDLLMWDPENRRATLLSRSPGATFRPRAAFDSALGAPRIVTDACGRLAMASLTGAFDRNTGISIVRIGETSAVGASIDFHTSVDDIEEMDLTRGGDGVLVAWLEGGNGRASPSRVLRVAYVR